MANNLHKIGFTFLLSFFFVFAKGQNDSLANNQTNEEDVNTLIDRVKTFVNEFTDVEALDHSLQVRSASKSVVKNTLEEIYAESGLDFTTYSSLRLDEFWPKVINRKKIYSIVNGKLDTIPIDNYESFSVNVKFIFFPNHDSTQYTIKPSAVVNQRLIDFLKKKNPQINLQKTVDTYLKTTNPALFVTYAKPKDAKGDILDVLDELYNKVYYITQPYTKELKDEQEQLDNINDEFPLASQNFHVVFKPHKNQEFGFDAYNPKYVAWKDDYQEINMEKDNTPYLVPFKSMAKYSADKVTAQLINTDPERTLVTTDSIKFVNSKGERIAVEKVEGNTFTLNLSNISGREKIYAVYRKNNPIGKLTAIGYTPETRLVHIVPLVDNVTIDIAQIEDTLNNIFGNAAAKFTVSEESKTINPNGNTFYNKAFDNPDVQFLAQYTTQMREARNAFVNAESNVNRQAHLIFVIKEFKDPNIRGYMARGRGFGFITKEAIEQGGNALAHELGHGAFGLKHTFDDIPKATTTNLMDYGNGKELVRRQWKIINSDFPTISWFDNEEDGEKIKIDVLEAIKSLKNTDGTYTFLTPDGEPVTLPGDITAIEISTLDKLIKLGKHSIIQKNAKLGSLLSFKANDGTKYVFSDLGYFNEGKGKFKPLAIIGEKQIRIFLGMANLNPNQLCYFAGRFEKNEFNTNDDFKVNVPELVKLIVENNNNPYKNKADKSYYDILKELDENLITVNINRSMVEFSDDSDENSRIVNDFFTLYKQTSYQGYLYYLMLANMPKEDREWIYNCGHDIDPHQFHVKVKKKHQELKKILPEIASKIKVVTLPDKTIEIHIPPMQEVTELRFLKVIDFALYAGILNRSKKVIIEAEQLRIEKAPADSVFHFLKRHGFSSCTFKSFSLETKKYIFQQLLTNNDFWYEDARWYTSRDGQFVLTILLNEFVRNPKDIYELYDKFFKKDNYKWLATLWDKGTKPFYDGVDKKDIYNFLDVLAEKIKARYANKTKLKNELDSLKMAKNEYMAFFASKLLYNSPVKEKHEYAIDLLGWYADKNWYSLTGKEEDVVISCFRSVKPTNKVDSRKFIQKLRTTNVPNTSERNKESILSFYYHKLNGEQFKEWIHLLYSRWFDYYNANKNKYKPLLINIESEKGWFFYSSNLVVQDVGEAVEIYQKVKDFTVKDVSGRNVKLGDTQKLHYFDGEDQDPYIKIGRLGYYDPIMNINMTNADGKINLPKAKPFPAIFLLAFHDLNVNSNLLTLGELTLDVALTFTGVGNLTKLRYLANGAKAIDKWQKARIVIGGVEATAGFLSLGLKLGTEDCRNGLMDQKLCNSIKTLLFWMEIGSFSADLFVGAKIKMAAKNVQNGLEAKKIKTSLSEGEGELLAGVKKITGTARNWNNFTHLNKLDQKILTRIENWPENALKKLDADIGFNDKLLHGLNNEERLINVYENAYKVNIPQKLRSNPEALKRMKSFCN